LSLLQRGAFPMNPTPNGLMFLPLTFELPLPSQLQLVDLVLVISVNLSGSSESTNRITLSRHAGIAKIVSNSCLYSVMVRINQHVAKYIWIPFFYRYMEHHSESFAIDPLDKNKSCIGLAKSPKNSSWARWSQQRRSRGSKRTPFPIGLLIRMVFILNSKLKHKSLDTTWNE